MGGECEYLECKSYREERGRVWWRREGERRVYEGEWGEERESV